MTTTSRFALLASLSIGFSASAYACGGTSTNPEESAEDVGTATAQITQVPPQVSCVKITVVGSRAVDRLFDVTPGQSSILPLTALPTGNVSFTGFAFPVACSALTVATTATWLSAPVPATLVAGAAPVNVALVMTKNGQANVNVDFQDDDGGVVDGGGNEADGGGNLVLSTTNIAYAPADCGSTLPQATFTATNNSNAAVSVISSLSGALTGFVVSPGLTTIPAQSSITFTITSPNGGVQTAGAVNGAVNLVANGNTQTVSVVANGRGAVLSFDTSSLVLPPGATVPFKVRNNGNMVANVSLSASVSSVTFTPPNGSIQINNSLFVEASRSLFPLGTGTITVNPTGTPVCGSLPVLPFTNN